MILKERKQQPPLTSSARGFKLFHKRGVCRLLESYSILQRAFRITLMLASNLNMMLFFPSQTLMSASRRHVPTVPPAWTRLTVSVAFVHLVEQELDAKSVNISLFKL